MRDVRIFENLDELSHAAAELFVDITTASITERGRCSVALSGGSTPKSLYRLLASQQFRNALDWTDIFFFIGDERNVPGDSPESNCRMVRETLFAALPIPEDRIHEWPTHREVPETIAEDYARDLEHFFSGFPRFDLVLLGLGADAHTASLFPDSPGLRENERFAIANWVEKLDDYRLTLTFPVLNNAANAIFLVSGKEKAEAVANVFEAEFRPDDLPAQFVQPLDGDLYWLLDRPAASRLVQPF
jgi:6-phosphogluconolactonase